MSSEAGIVFGGHGMGRDSVMRNLSLLNALWDGASHRVERRTSDSFTLSGARLTMGLAAQPETVRQFMEGTNGLARGNGFAARFLIAVPATTQGSRLFRDAPPWRHLPTFAARLGAMLEMLPMPDDSGVLILPALELSAEARAEWIRFHDDVSASWAQAGKWPAPGTWRARQRTTPLAWRRYFTYSHMAQSVKLAPGPSEVQRGSLDGIYTKPEPF
jgi:putative DNA primase/helicase